MIYKEGDHVRIKDIDWYNKNKSKSHGTVACGDKYFEYDMREWCGKTMTILTAYQTCYIMQEDGAKNLWTDEMIECKVEKETKSEPKFKVGDRICSKRHKLYDLEIIEVMTMSYGQHYYRIENHQTNRKYLMWEYEMSDYELVEKENKPEPKFKVGDKVILDPYPCVVTDVNWRDSLHGFVYTVRGTDFEMMVGEEDLIFDTSEEETYDFLKTDKPNKPSLNDFMDMLDNKIKLPEGYIFKDENGNPINTNLIVLEKKKKEYPKTYEDCCEIVKVGKEHTLEGEIIRKNNYKIDLLESFQKLLICRDAYWKLYGEEMGLDGPWEPTMETVYCISRNNNVMKCSYRGGKSNILEFPTEEMRDEFYENFKSEIESCKEFL